MFNTKNAITILLIALGLTLFYLWYSTWHRNISTNSLNKQLIQDDINKPNNTNASLTPPAIKPSSSIPVSNKPVAENQNKTVDSKSNNTKPKEISNQNVENKTVKKPATRKPVKLLKPAKKYIAKPIKKPIISKPVVKPPVVKKPVAPSLPVANKSLKLQLQKNTKNPRKYIRLENGAYQAGAFKSFADALSLSLELKAEGKRTKIIHQNGFYKVIVY